jgi:hypothetical protein
MNEGERCATSTAFLDSVSLPNLEVFTSTHTKKIRLNKEIGGIPRAVGVETF